MKDSYAVLPFFHFSWKWGVISKTSRQSRTWKQSFVQLVSVKGRLTSCLLVGTGKKSPGRDDERWPGKAGSRTIPFNFPFLEVRKIDSTCAGTFWGYGPSGMDEVGIGLRGPSQQRTKSLDFPWGWGKRASSWRENQYPRHLGKLFYINDACFDYHLSISRPQEIARKLIITNYGKSHMTTSFYGNNAIFLLSSHPKTRWKSMGEKEGCIR